MRNVELLLGDAAVEAEDVHVVQQCVGLFPRPAVLREELMEVEVLF